MSNLDKLIQYFEGFPGIGGRQARRFAFHILRMSPSDTQDFASLITSLKSSVIECSFCHRFFSKQGKHTAICAICSDPNRDRGKLMIVERDTDIQSIERSATYDGLYFILGGTVPLLNSKGTQKLRSAALKAYTRTLLTEGLKEIILGFAINPDGENTARYVESLLSETLQDAHIHITHLGRGLSTGSELEYADPETIKNALRNRG